MNIYAENILDHYHNPRGKLEARSSPFEALRPSPRARASEPRAGPNGKLEATHTESNPACGDEITVGMITQNGRVATLQWDGTGCAISQAAMSMLSEKFGSKPESNIETYTKEDMLALLGVPIGPRRLKCALLGLHTCKNCLRKVKKQEVLGWTQGILGEK